MTRIEEIEQRLAKATPGPWHSSESETIPLVIQTSHFTRDVWVIPRSIFDAEFIANAPDDIRFLLDELKVTEEEFLAENQAAVDMFGRVEELKDKLKIAEEALEFYTKSETTYKAFKALAQIRGDG
jgi:hypothetical protein